MDSVTICTIRVSPAPGHQRSPPSAGPQRRSRKRSSPVVCVHCCCAFEALAPPPALSSSCAQATLHLVNREYAALADDFITLGLLPPGSDRAAIIPALTAVFQARSPPPISRRLNPGRTSSGLLSVGGLPSGYTIAGIFQA